MQRRFSRPGDRGFERFEKPVKVGETYDVEIKETGSKGDGIARVKNFVVFVANAKKGDKCKIKITQVARRFAIGEKVGKEEAEVTETQKEVKKEPEVSEEKEEKKKETEEVKEKPKKKTKKKGEKVEDK
jgi:predicted RNA-binding protein with TRAM domain